MNFCFPLIAAVGMTIVAGDGSTSGQDLDLPVEQITGSKPADLMEQYWRRQAEKAFQRWRADYEVRKSPEQIAAYQKDLHEKFIAAIGGLPERTPLNPQVTGRVDREGYLVEKIVFESQPKHFVTALFFLHHYLKLDPAGNGLALPHLWDFTGETLLPGDRRVVNLTGTAPKAPGMAKINIKFASNAGTQKYADWDYVLMGKQVVRKWE